jgi:hypothetical protein
MNKWFIQQHGHWDSWFVEIRLFECVIHSLQWLIGIGRSSMIHGGFERWIHSIFPVVEWLNHFFQWSSRRMNSRFNGSWGNWMGDSLTQVILWVFEQPFHSMLMIRRHLNGGFIPFQWLGATLKNIYRIESDHTNNLVSNLSEVIQAPSETRGLSRNHVKTHFNDKQTDELTFWPVYHDPNCLPQRPRHFVWKTRVWEHPMGQWRVLALSLPWHSAPTLHRRAGSRAG